MALCEDGRAELAALAAGDEGKVVFVINHSCGNDWIACWERYVSCTRKWRDLLSRLIEGLSTRSQSRAQSGLKVRCASLANPIPVTVVKDARKTYFGNSRAHASVCRRGFVQVGFSSLLCLWWPGALREFTEVTVSANVSALSLLGVFDRAMKYRLHPHRFRHL
jgi:hypothetical protein